MTNTIIVKILFLLTLLETQYQLRHVKYILKNLVILALGNLLSNNICVTSLNK